MLNLVSKASAIVLCGLLFVNACGKQSAGGEEVKPKALDTIPLPDVSQSQGVYPSKSVLDDIQNPFRSAVATDDLQWALNTWGADANGAPIPERSSARFYIWATKLANFPTGTAQMYVGNVLKDLSATASLTDEQKASYRKAAIAAYQSVLDNFPDSVTYYDAVHTYRNVAVAFNAISDMGEIPKGDWIILPGFGGNTVVPGH